MIGIKIDSEPGGGGASKYNMGWYTDEASLTLAHPVGVDGDFAIVGSTDTFRVRDGDTNAWIDTGVSGSGGTYSLQSPSTIAVGGTTPGYLLSGKTWQTIVQDTYAPYINPTFSAFAMGGFASAVRECGNILTVNGPQTATRSTTTPANIIPNTIDIRDMTAGVDRATGLANDGSEAIAIGSVIINSNTPAAVSQQFRIQATNTNTVLFNRLATYTYTFVYPFYVGHSAKGDYTGRSTYTDIETNLVRVGGPNKLVETQGNKAIIDTMTNQVNVFMYPASYPVLTSILDNSSFETISNYDVYTTNIVTLSGQTVSYRVYELKNNASQVAFTNTYKF